MAKENVYRVRVPFWGCLLLEVLADSEDAAIKRVWSADCTVIEKSVEEYDPEEFWHIEVVE